MFDSRLFNAINYEIYDWLEAIIASLPGRTGISIRRIYWSRKLMKSNNLSLRPGCKIISPQNISLGNDLKIMSNCFLAADKNGRISIGNNVRINSDVKIDASINGEIIIGSNVLIGPNVVIRSSDHIFEPDLPIIGQGHLAGKIVIEDNCWIGANVVILKNVTVGKGSVVGAGAVVTKSISPFSIAAGVPAKKIRIIESKMTD